MLVISPIIAGSQPYDFKDPKQISAVSLTLDSMLEPIVGYAKGLSGVIRFDPGNPGATKGKLAVDVSSIIFANDGYTAGRAVPTAVFLSARFLRPRRGGADALRFPGWQ